MSHYKPYPAYKDSGVEWLGKVPEHWEVLPLRSVASVNDDEREQSSNSIESIRYIDISTVSLEDGIAEPAVIDVQDAPGRAQRKAKAGDIVLSTVRTYLRAIGQVHQQHEDCIFSTGFAVIRPSKNLEPDFLYSALLSEPLLAEIEANSKGVSYPAINASEVMLFKLPVPPKLEQERIAEVLKCETARIDALVSKKTRFIELLREKRQALITHAVTKGLDPNVKMKDSGVEWLGEVPEHWEVLRLRFLAEINPPIRDDISYAPDMEVSFLPMEYIGEDGSLRLESLRTVESVRNGYSYFEDGDVAFAKVTPCFENGKGALMRGLVCGVGFGTTELTVLRPNTMVTADFLNFVVKSDAFRRHGAGNMTGAGGLKRVPDEFTRNFVVALPPVSEQQDLTTHLDREAARIDAIIAKSQYSIDLLKERRSALITAAVTGQIDLRPDDLRTTSDFETGMPKPQVDLSAMFDEVMAELLAGDAEKDAAKVGELKTVKEERVQHIAAETPGQTAAIDALGKLFAQKPSDDTNSK